MSPPPVGSSRRLAGRAANEVSRLDAVDGSESPVGATWPTTKHDVCLPEMTPVRGDNEKHTGDRQSDSRDDRHIRAGNSRGSSGRQSSAAPGCRSASGCDLLASLLVRRERVVRESDEVESVSAVVADLNERLVAVSLDNGPEGAGGPPAGVDPKLDDGEDLVLDDCHRLVIVAAAQGMSTQVEVNRGGAPAAIIQVVTTAAVRPLIPSIITITS